MKRTGGGGRGGSTQKPSPGANSAVICRWVRVVASILTPHDLIMLIGEEEWVLSC